MDEADRRIPWETATKPRHVIALSVLVDNHHVLEHHWKKEICTRINVNVEWMWEWFGWLGCWNEGDHLSPHVLRVLVGADVMTFWFPLAQRRVMVGFPCEGLPRQNFEGTFTCMGVGNP